MTISFRAVALALPFALGLACTHARSSRAQGTTTQGTAAAESTPSSTDSSVAIHPGDELVAGRVTDLTSDAISIDPGPGEALRTLRIVPQTVITVGGQAATAAEIRQGDDVRASYRDVDGEDVAVRIASGEPWSGSSTAPATNPAPPDTPDSAGVGGAAGAGGDTSSDETKEPH